MLSTSWLFTNSAFVNFFFLLCFILVVAFYLCIGAGSRGTQNGLRL